MRAPIQQRLTVTKHEAAPGDLKVVSGSSSPVTTAAATHKSC